MFDTEIAILNMNNEIDVSELTDVYFSKSKQALETVWHNPRVVYQIFQRQSAILCGMKYVEDLLTGLPSTELWGLKDGDEIEPLETIALLTGPVQELIEFETIYLGMLARLTKIATNVRQSVIAANGKKVFFFPARFDLFVNQPYDGYAARIGGANGCSTATQAAQAFPNKPIGTSPHALIAAFKGDTLAATLALLKARPRERVTVLADFHNNCAKTAVEVYLGLKAEGLEYMMAAVRLDTSQSLVDEGVADSKDCCQRGVTPQLVQHVRRELDKVGATHVGICVSGGFDVQKIKIFEEMKVPVSSYAVGEKFLMGSYAFTSDLVAQYEGQKMILCSKVGREYKPNPRLRKLI